MRVFQLYVEQKNKKPSLELFFHLFYVTRASRDKTWDQGLIFLRPNVPWFDPFINDWDNFLEHFMLVKPITLEAQSAFC